MKSFIKAHKKLFVTSCIFLVLIFSCVIWIEIRIGFNNLPLNKINGTVESLLPSNVSDQYTTYYIKLDDSSSWPECEYVKVKYDIKDIREGDKVTLLCSDWMDTSFPPELTVFFMWKK